MPNPLSEPLLEKGGCCGPLSQANEDHGDALLWQQTRLVPSLHIGLGLTIFALCSLAFGTTTLVLDALFAPLPLSGLPLGLRIFSLVLSALTTLLAALMLRADRAECALPIRLGRTVALSFLASAGAIGYALLFERDMVLSGGGAQAGVIGELASTACLAWCVALGCVSTPPSPLRLLPILTRTHSFSVLLLVWNIAHSYALGDEEGDEGCIDDDAEAAEGSDETPPVLLDEAALLQMAEESAARAVRSVEGAPRVRPSRALRDLSVRHPLILCGIGLLAFAATTAGFTGARVVGSALTYSTTPPSADPSAVSTADMNSLYAAVVWDGLPIPDGFVPPQNGWAAPPAQEEAEDLQDVNSLLLTIVTLFVGFLVLREEQRACAVPPSEAGLRAASVLGSGTAVFSLAYISFSPGGSHLASSICTAVFSILLLSWNAVRMLTLPAEEEEEVDEEALPAVEKGEEKDAALLQSEAASLTE